MLGNVCQEICVITSHAGADVSSVPRDQGFTRPKALILLPMRNMAFAVVRRLVALAQKETRADSVQVGCHRLSQVPAVVPLFLPPCGAGSVVMMLRRDTV
jgi:hypothetical protein